MNKNKVDELFKIDPLPLPGKGLDEVYYTEEENSYTLREFYAEYEKAYAAASTA